jgi:hypothetical protein
VKGLLQKDFNFPEKERDVFMFLKAIDRAFWLRHFKLLEMLGKNENRIEQLKTVKAYFKTNN